MRCRRSILSVAVLCLAVSTAAARTNTPYLLLYPQKWETALTNYAAFKTRLGFRIYTDTVENVTGGDTNNYALVRSYLTDFRTNTAPTNETVYVLMFGNYYSIPAPTFRVHPDDSSTYFSDIYYRDLHTEFDNDGDGVFAEYGTGATNDFDSTAFNTFFPHISNDLVVGRIPIHQSWNASSAEAVVDHIMAFEREVGDRKLSCIMSAGRIDTNLSLADSWVYVLRDLVDTVTSTYPEKQVTTVVHCASNYSDRTGIDYAIEGNSLSADYVRGQDLIRGLWESNNACSFLCNVSHGGSYSDFSITRLGAGLPQDVGSAIMISMSCASYQLGKAALTNGLCATYLGSTAVVTPDVATLIFSDMVSAEVQRRAAEKIFCQNVTVGKTFQEEFDYYVDEIQTAGLGIFYGSSKPELLRNIVGFGITGDPTLVHAYDDHDGDGLLDPEEEYLGTCTNNWDSDGDGLSDSLEFLTDGYDPLVHDGTDVDGDDVSNEGETIAGTDPFSAASFPHIADITCTGGTPVLMLRWESVTGRTYAVQSVDLLDGSTWTNCSAAQAGTGGTMTFAATNDIADALYYRVNISRP